MLLEMHCHTAEHSPCSSLAAVDLVRQVFARGLQGVVITDHHYLWSAEELADLRHRTGVPEHFRLLSGQELRSEEFGDILVYGATASIPRGTSLMEVRRCYPDAALVWAHPYRGRMPPGSEKLTSPLLDGVEIFNSNHTVRGNSLGLQDWHRYRFTAIAGTDTHGSGYAGLYPTIFDHPLTTMDELAVEIKHGRCRPFFKEIPRAGANSLVTEVTIGIKGVDESRERIIIRELADRRQWVAAERGHRIMAAIVAKGFSAGPYRVPRPIDKDPAAMTLIEQGVRGKLLFDKLLSSTHEDGREYLQLAARWLARLHGLRLRVTAVDEFLSREGQRLSGYQERFDRCQNRHGHKVEELVAAIFRAEEALVAASGADFVQGHGDFHPKNIIVGQDSQDNRDTLYVAAIDFESSLVLPASLDVGCFLAQFRNQFILHRSLQERYPESVFLDAYLAASGELSPGFVREVELFRARTNLSIAAYLVKLGLGESADVWRVLVEAERALTNL